MRIPSVRRLGVVLAAAGTLGVGALSAFEPKEPVGFLELVEFSATQLYLGGENAPLEEVLAELPNREAWEALRDAHGDSGGGIRAFVDLRSGAATNLLGAFPLLPGTGVGNAVTLDELASRLGRPVSAVTPDVVAEVVRAFVLEHAAVLGIEPSQLGRFAASAVDDRLWHVRAPQVVGGLEVRNAVLVATLVHGNLVLVGTEAWGAAKLDATPALDAEHAVATGFDHAGGRSLADLIVRAPRLEIVPVAPPELQAGEVYAGSLGAGYRHRLVWSFVFRREPELASWEVLVDAHDGEVLAFQDLNQYVQRGIVGGVYPNTSTEICPTPGTCGTMQSGWPMPYANTGLAMPNNFANSAGVFDWTAGTVTTTLNGRYFRMQDVCGAISASSATGDIDLLGTNAQHDCTTPGIGGAGNTPASRSGFYELNRIAEQGRGWLPGNSWLQSQVTSNMNINNTCNAFWSSGAGTVNFYRSGGGCRNTGEIAGVFDHEWGHGLDDNDTGGSLSSSSEGYADIAAILRLQTSCIGFGFNLPPALSCGLTADGTGRNRNENQVGGTHCDTNCSGVRDADWALHVPNTPDTPLGFVCNECLTGGNPCNRQVHCAAAPSRQAAWDFVARDLVTAPFNFDSQSAFLVGAKVFYQGSGLIASWHSCTCGGSANGCGGTNAYMQWLAADDDNGNVNDGTPHMTALHAAFDRHGIACATPTPQNSGCSGGPAAPPTLTVTPGNYQNQLSWTTVPGATRYWVMRTEGHAGCDYGKTRIADVTTTSYLDTAVMNGRTYYYNVVAQGSSAACYTRVSACVEGTPGASTFALTVTVNGSGDVASSPPGIACPSDCSESYDSGTVVTLSQTADPGWVFTGWDGDCTGTGACQVTMNAVHAVTANFVELRALTVSVTGSGTVTSSPAGISCPSDCTEEFADATAVTLSQTADPGWVFTGWSGDCTGTGACQVTMDAARSVTATFTQLRALSVAVAGSGSVTSSPGGISCPPDCTEEYLDGATVALSQSADPGWVFIGWSGDCAGTGACQVTMDAARSVTATFAQLRALTVTVGGPGTVTSTPAGISCPADCDEAFLDGTSVELEATADPGAYFVGWSGDCTGTGSCDLTMDGPHAATATFDTMPFLDGFETGDTSRWSSEVP